LFSFFCQFINFYSHVTSCTPCAKAKAAYKHFDINKVYVKARAEIVQRLKAKRTKQQMNMEWKAEVLRKLKDLSELQGLRKDVWRIVMALKKLAGIEGQNSDNKQYSWPESEGKEIEVQESTQKGK